MKLQFIEKYLIKEERKQEEKEMARRTEEFYNQLIFLILKEVDEYWYFQLMTLKEDYTYLENLLSDQLPTNIWADTILKILEATKIIYKKLPEPKRMVNFAENFNKEQTLKQILSSSFRVLDNGTISFENYTNIPIEKYDLAHNFEKIKYMLQDKIINSKNEENVTLKVEDVFYDDVDIKVLLSNGNEMYLWELYENYYAPRTLPSNTEQFYKKEKDELRCLSLKAAMKNEDFYDSDNNLAKVINIYYSYDEKYILESYNVPVTIICFELENGKKETLPFQIFSTTYKTRTKENIETYKSLIEKWRKEEENELYKTP